MEKIIKDVCAKLKLGDFKGFEEIKVGHINNTFLVRCGEGKYILQKINTNVFKNPEGVMKNIDYVTEYIRKEAPSETLHFHHTPDGANYLKDGDCVWRLYTYREGFAPNDTITEEIMRQCGKAFGNFQMRLSGFDATLLSETIPDFHNTAKRYEHFLSSVTNDVKGRAKDVASDIELAKSLKDVALKVGKMDLPLRVTHNDTKTNNVLLDDNLEPVCVIDLDTVMPGLMAHDFGDAIRFGANTAAEDEKDLSKVSVSLPLYKAFAEGFIGAVAKVMTKEELEAMALGAVTMTFECGIRFLDDYLSGDTYFRIAYPEHNLVRARCQLKLASDMVAHLDEMNAIAKEVYSQAQAF